jgi:hypothetical protein
MPFSTLICDRGGHTAILHSFALLKPILFGFEGRALLQTSPTLERIVNFHFRDNVTYYFKLQSISS